MMRTPSAFLSFVQLLDSALPIGGFSHSFGLETYVQQGKVASVTQLEQYMTGQIHASLVRMDGLAIKGVYSAIAEQDWESVARLDTIIHVQRAPRESREGMHKMGRRLIKLGKSLYPEARLSQLEDLLERYHGYGTYPIVFAWIAWHLAMELDAAVHGYLYTSVQTMANSALRLMSIGQTEGQLLIRRMQVSAEKEWMTVCSLPSDQPHSFSAAHDILAMQHETLYSRLFMS